MAREGGGARALSTLIALPRVPGDALACRYNFDNELRGGSSESSWDELKPFGPHWMAFLGDFADALHAVNKTLSVDIAGCCGWADTAHPETPLGHCFGGFSNHEFVYTSCAEYAASKLDVVYGMSSCKDPDTPVDGGWWVVGGGW